MKNIQVIDSAFNCAYDIYQISDELYDLIFPDPDQNVEFIEDFSERVWTKLPLDAQTRYESEMYSSPVPKSDVQGIHGTLFYELEHEKRPFYPNKRESDLNARGREWDHP